MGNYREKRFALYLRSDNAAAKEQNHWSVRARVALGHQLTYKAARLALRF